MTQTAVVTGGGTGIGRAVAGRLARDGFAVTITGRRAEVLKETADDLGVQWVAFDAAEPDQVRGALADLPETVDVLVNNAGGNVRAGAGDDLAGIKAQWLANFEANVLTAVLVTEALTPRFAHGVRVITIGSIAGTRGGGDYGAAKGALVPWNLDLAQDVGKLGGTANVVAPGFVADTEFFGDALTEQRRERLVGQTLVGRPGVPDDIAEMVAHLASPGARHVTAQVLHVNGGALAGR
ncbi:SDR family NAD(P)-dependent oxidoreductase [Labedaea rhizosphaerae]|uniref:3-oxoacyl-[acyl-carrier protein] reductase n=1 Tax=Labedaea rhizosphaerae TaxID=598644 RepID=A0A4R6SBT9_LABRH|nr:SDR family oxidoreductase [Labedaea rhizosphaerae]TDP97441.1 3-oxoacyl-[acyl-carrier protein] reductase [Labedaea rhizosphaerae]